MNVAADTQEPDEPLEAPEDADEVVLPWWQNPVNIAVIVVAAFLIAGMLGWIIGDSGGEVESSDADVGFLHDMRAHHEQAVEMSLTFLGRPGIDRGLIPVARSIAFGQAQETGLMIQLLYDMNAPTEGEAGQAMAWMGHGPLDEADMPGMADIEQLRALANAEGREADELFIDLMIAHHEGGIEMLNAAVELAENDDVRRYAEAWAMAQADEIRELAGLR